MTVIISISFLIYLIYLSSGHSLYDAGVAGFTTRGSIIMEDVSFRGLINFFVDDF